MRSALVLLAVLVGCTRAPLRDRVRALRHTSAPVLSDDLGRKDFVAALRQHTDFLASIKDPRTLRFGTRLLSLEDYVRALHFLLVASEQMPGDAAFFELIGQNFDFFEVYGAGHWGETLLTSYFEPQILASKKKTEEHSAPLFGRPEDLIEIAAHRFDDRLDGLGALRGRLEWNDAKKRHVLAPYFTRAEIDSGSLRERGLELAWVDPIDAFFMQIQGSGTLLLEKGERLRLGYADQNGHQYYSIGRSLTGVIALEKMSLFTIEQYLRSIDAAVAKRIMNKNPSFVFFQKQEGEPKTSLGTSAYPGRTIATDARFFPKGALAFLQFKKPRFNSPADAEPQGWEPVSRFVLDQDTGGAIRGGGRVDLFWGSGDEAKRFAGFVKDTARLYYLVPKPQWLEQRARDELDVR